VEHAELSRCVDLENGSAPAGEDYGTIEISFTVCYPIEVASGIVL
jgi:hypothetical protein